jgi:abortive infection bacteriophage resistance protein
MNYTKQAKTIEDQLNLLKCRGLIIIDEEYAIRCLRNISYYRLAGYWWSMQSDKVKHKFKPGSTFANVIDIYNFDRELRGVIFSLIERIEIAFRTRLIHYLSLELDPWWFENQVHFKNGHYFQKNLETIERELNSSKESFIMDHKKKYREDIRKPPAWKTMEVLSLGTLSKIYSNLNTGLRSKNQIAKDFGIPNYTYLNSWLQAVTQVRNICAHHGRLWNRTFPIIPKLMMKPPGRWIEENPLPEEQRKLYLQLCSIRYLLVNVEKENHFQIHLQKLLSKYSNIDPKAMGFTKNWQEQPIWKD